MPACVVKSCKSYTTKKKDKHGITYHRFPRNKIRKEEWIQIIRKWRGDNNWNPTDNNTICSKHFDDTNFIITAKGRRLLVPYAVPTMLSANSSEKHILNTALPTLQMSQLPNINEVVSNQQSQSSLSTISSVSQVTHKLPLAGYCRFCAISNCNGELVDVQNDNILKDLVVNMLNRLNTNIDFNKENLPTSICPLCIKSLYSAYDFVVGIDLAQTTLNKILRISSNIGAAESNSDESLPFMSNLTTSIPVVPKIEVPSSDLDQPQSHLLEITTSFQHVVTKEEGQEEEDEQVPKMEVSANDLDQTKSHLSDRTTAFQQILVVTKKEEQEKENEDNEEEQEEPSSNYGAEMTTPGQLLVTNSSNSCWSDTTKERLLKFNLIRKVEYIDRQKKNIKRLNQLIRRLRRRNDSLKTRLSSLKKTKTLTQSDHE